MTVTPRRSSARPDRRCGLVPGLFPTLLLLAIPIRAVIPAADVSLLPSEPHGVIPGVFSVSGNGAAGYEIPIVISR